MSQNQSMKKIDNFDWYYVTCDGNIWSEKSHKYIKPTFDKLGYPRVVLWKNSKGYCIKIHRLVAQYFVPNHNDLPEVNHKDGDKSNTHYTNLEWCTRSDNVKHAYRTGLMRPVHPYEHENYRRLYNG
jgi:hypothetical protein